MKATQKLDQLWDRINSVKYKSDELGKYAFVDTIAYLKEVQVIAKQTPHTENLCDQLDALIWMLNEYLIAAVFSPRHRSVWSEKIVEFNLLFDELRFLAQRSQHQNIERFRSVHAQAA